ncbi:hypothetical protein MCERE10_02370 [Burkholderiaceae bacterium]
MSLTDTFLAFYKKIPLKDTYREASAFLKKTPLLPHPLRH